MVPTPARYRKAFITAVSLNHHNVNGQVNLLEHASARKWSKSSSQPRYQRRVLAAH